MSGDSRSPLAGCRGAAPADLTPARVESCLKSSGRLPAGASVKALAVEPCGIQENGDPKGLVSIMARVTCEYEVGGGRRRPEPARPPLGATRRGGAGTTTTTHHQIAQATMPQVYHDAWPRGFPSTPRSPKPPDAMPRHVVVCLGSISFDSSELVKIPGVFFYEERLLFMLLLLRHPSLEVSADQALAKCWSRACELLPSTTSTTLHHRFHYHAHAPATDITATTDHLCHIYLHRDLRLCS